MLVTQTGQVNVSDLLIACRPSVCRTHQLTWRIGTQSRYI